MARKINELDYQEKRKQIIQAAMKYIYSVGFEQMSVQNLIEDLRISKGAFYHYFSSKDDLLIALIDDMSDTIYEQINPIIDHPSMTGLEKMNAYFEKAGLIKLENAEFLIPITRIWYDDRNILVRERLLEKSSKIIGPVLTKFIQQGISEGVFASDYPEAIGQAVFQIFLNMGNSIAKQLIFWDKQTFSAAEIIQTIDIYTDIFEKVLQAPKGSIVFISKPVIEKWVTLFQRA